MAGVTFGVLVFWVGFCEVGVLAGLLGMGGRDAIQMPANEIAL